MKDLEERREVMAAAGIARALARMASEIVEQAEGSGELALVGIRTGGVPLAGRLADLIERSEGVRPPVGTVDITLYRDDVFRGLPAPEVGPTEIPFALDDRVVVLVDDVLYTGRTVRAAIDALFDLGRPRAIRLAVLIDRGHRELPIRADHVGRVVETEARESVKVFLAAGEGEREAVVVRGLRR